jgi:hypothetical protein
MGNWLEIVNPFEKFQNFIDLTVENFTKWYSLHIWTLWQHGENKNNVIAEEVMVQGEVKETKPKSMSQEIIHH